MTGTPSEHSFVQDARRRQLVTAAVDVIAEVGLADATFTRIAERAGISRSLVNYHFTDRDDLVAEVVAEVYRLGDAEVRPAVEAPTRPRDRLRAFISASVAFYHAHPRHLGALGAIHRAAWRTGGGGREAWETHVRELSDLRAVLLDGQQAGEFRDFDVTVVANAVRAVLDSALLRLADPTADPIALATELGDLVDAAVATT